MCSYPCLGACCASVRVHLKRKYPRRKCIIFRDFSGFHRYRGSEDGRNGCISLLIVILLSYSSCEAGVVLMSRCPQPLRVGRVAPIARHG